MTQALVEARWVREIEELEKLVPRTAGKFRFEVRPRGLYLTLICRSPVMQAQGEPLVRVWEHGVDLLRPPTWPAQSLILIHRRPGGALHPNVLYPVGGDRRLSRRLARGLICYTDRPSPQQRLVTVVEQLYNMLGYRFGRYSRDLDDCLSPVAVRWLNNVLAENPDLIPTERRPFLERGRAEGGRS